MRYPTTGPIPTASANPIPGEVGNWFGVARCGGWAQSRRFPFGCMWSISPGPQPPQFPLPEPCMRFSRTRLSPRPSISRIPPCQRRWRVTQASLTVRRPHRQRAGRLIALQAIPRSSLVASHTWLEALRSDRVMLSRSSSLLRPPPTSARHFTVSQVRWLSVSMLPGTTSWRSVVFYMPGVETDLSSSKDTLLTIPRPLRREVPRHPLQVLWCRPWPSPIGEGLGSSSSTNGGPA
jgi:hypothetical protein